MWTVGWATPSFGELDKELLHEVRERPEPSRLYILDALPKFFCKEVVVVVRHFELIRGVGGLVVGVVRDSCRSH